MRWFSKHIKIGMTATLFLFLFHTIDVCARNAPRLKSRTTPQVYDQDNSFEIIQTGRWAGAGGTTNCIYLVLNLIGGLVVSGNQPIVLNQQKVASGTISYNAQNGQITLANAGNYRITAKTTINVIGAPIAIYLNGATLSLLNPINATTKTADIIVQTSTPGEVIYLRNSSISPITVSSPTYIIIEQI